MEENTSYENFESIFMEQLNTYEPMKVKYMRANNAPFMSQALRKAIINWWRGRTKFLRLPNDINKANYKQQRNYCMKLLRKEKKTITKSSM